MIKGLSKRWELKKSEIFDYFSNNHPENYKEIVSKVIEKIGLDELSDYAEPAMDYKRIVEINFGDYQGTLVYVIGSYGYQPSDHYYVLVDYGSCSTCDTFQSIKYAYFEETQRPSEQQAKDYLTLALHIAQGIKKMC